MPSRPTILRHPQFFLAGPALVARPRSTLSSVVATPEFLITGELAWQLSRFLRSLTASLASLTYRPKAADEVIGVSNNCYQSYGVTELIAAWRHWCEAWERNTATERIARESLVGRVLFQNPAPPRDRDNAAGPLPNVPVFDNAAARPHPAALRAYPNMPEMPVLRTFAVSTTTYYVPATAPAFPCCIPTPGHPHRHRAADSSASASQSRGRSSHQRPI